MVTLLEELQLNKLKDIEDKLEFWFDQEGNCPIKNSQILTLIDLKLLINEAYY